jgi:hypothetical protein
LCEPKAQIIRVSRTLRQGSYPYAGGSSQGLARKGQLLRATPVAAHPTTAAAFAQLGLVHQRAVWMDRSTVNEANDRIIDEAYQMQSDELKAKQFLDRKPPSAPCFLLGESQRHIDSARPSVPRNICIHCLHQEKDPVSLVCTRRGSLFISRAFSFCGKPPPQPF